MARPGERYVGSSWFFRFRYRWQRSFERLTDAEAGRLVKAMLYYSMTGGEVDLPGKESVLMSMLLDDLEEDRTEAAGTSCTNRANALKRWHGEAAPDGCDRMRPHTTAYKDGKEEDGIPPVVPPKGGQRSGRRRRREESRYTEQDFRMMEAQEIDLGAVDLGDGPEDPEKEGGE